MRSVFVFGGALLAACHGKPAPTGSGSGSGSGSSSAPIRIAFGDCAQSELFVSGPRPVGPEDRVGAPLRENRPTSSELDAETINRVVRQHASEARKCYQQALANAPKLSGKLKVSFTVGKTGAVTQANATGMSGSVGPCVEKVIRAMVFPPTGSESHINYPFVFSNGEQSIAPIGSKLEALHPDAPAILPSAVGSAAHGQMPVQSVVWESGATSPLRPQRAAIEACVRRHGDASGVALIGLDFTHGAEPLVSANGTNALSKCLIEIKVQKPPGAPDHLHCAFAWGNVGFDAMPAIQITSTDVTLAGTSIAHVADLVADASASSIPKLRAELAMPDRNVAAVPIRGVGLIEPIATTPMKLVYRAIRSTYEAEAEYTLAIEANGTWQSLREIAMPVEPIAVGTGGSWIDARHGTLAGDVADSRPRVSVYVQADKMWVGVSGVKQFQEIPGRDWKQLEAALAATKDKPALPHVSTTRSLPTRR